MRRQNKNSLDEGVSSYKSPAYEIARKLRQMGYEIADCIGMRQNEPDRDSVGILQLRDPVQKSFLGIKYNKKQRALYLGTLWLDNPPRKAKEDEKWILDVYGKENISQLTDVVKKLSESYSIKFQVELKTENPKLETFLDDLL